MLWILKKVNVKTVFIFSLKINPRERKEKNEKAFSVAAGAGHNSVLSSM